MPISRRQIRLRQALWIACIVVILTVLIVVISWLTAGPPPSKDPDRAAVAPVPATEINRPSFAPEAPAPGEGRAPLPEARAVPSSAPIQVADLSSPSASDTPSASRTETETSAEPIPPATPSPKPPAPLPKAVPPPTAPASTAPVTSGFGVQVGAFGSETTAKEMKSRLERLGYRVTLLPKGNLTRVVATGFADRAAAQKAQEKLRTQGAPQAQVISLE